MKSYMKTLFMVLLLVFATLPSYAVDVAAKEGGNFEDDDDSYKRERSKTIYDGDLYKQPETKESYGAYYIDDPIESPRLPQEPVTFWLNKGQQKVFNQEQGFSLTYLGSISKTSKIGADTPEGIFSEDVCEQFQMAYFSKSRGKNVASKEVALEEPSGDQVFAPSSTTVEPIALAAQSSSGKKPTPVTAQQIKDSVKSTSVIKHILGEDAYDAILVDKSSIAVQPMPVDTTTLEALMKRATDLALIVGGEANTAFTFNDQDVALALANILRGKGVQLSQQWNGNWKSENVQVFIKYNNIDADQFFQNVRAAQKALATAQIQTYNAFLYLEAYNLPAAEQALNDAQQVFHDTYEPLMKQVMTEINRWKSLPLKTSAKQETIPVMPIDASASTKVFCLVPGEVGYPIMLYEKKGDSVLVGYNSWKDQPSYTVPSDSADTKAVDTKQAKNQGTCVVKGNGVVPVGTRVNVESVSQFCDPLTEKMLSQKADGEVAENNYECLSNEARNGQCVNSLNFLQKIW